MLTTDEERDLAPERERSLDPRHWWPGYLIGYLPDDLERLRRPDPKALLYPLTENPR